MVGFDITLEVGDEFVARQEPIGRVAPILGAWQPDEPVGGDEGEGVPPAVAPGMASLRSPFEDDVLAAALGQVIACRQTGLASANDDSLDCVVHLRILTGNMLLSRASGQVRL